MRTSCQQGGNEMLTPDPTDYKCDVVDWKSRAKIARAKALFDMGSYDSVSNLLEGGLDRSLEKSQDGLFIANFAALMSARRRDEIRTLQNVNYADIVGCVEDAALLSIESRLRDFVTVTGRPLDGLNLWLLSTILRETKRRSESRVVLLESLRCCPFNWSGWVDLVRLLLGSQSVSNGPLTESMEIEGYTEIKLFQNDPMMSFRGESFQDFRSTLGLADHFMAYFGYAEYLLMTQRWGDAARLLGSLIASFPRFPYLVGTLARCAYKMRLYDWAITLFEDLTNIDPHDLSYVDDLAEILHSSGQLPELSKLAAKVTDLEPNGAVSLCVVGQYYAALGDFAKAAAQYKRAVQLQPNYVNGYILLGNALLDLNASAEARGAYQVAIKIAPKDYRGWFGIGQVYDVTKMADNALHHYYRAVDLYDQDFRVWSAISTVMEQKSRNEEAAVCFKKAWMLGRKFPDVVGVFRNVEKAQSSGETIVIWAKEVIRCWLLSQQRGKHDTEQNSLCNVERRGDGKYILTNDELDEDHIPHAGQHEWEDPSALHTVGPQLRDAPAEVGCALVYLLEHFTEQEGIAKSYAMLLSHVGEFVDEKGQVGQLIK
eukprot:Platyproteum_vivax@DN2309_c0_g1_i1.p1